MDDWDPMDDDYKSVSFNSYNRGPGRDQPLDSHPRFKGKQQSPPSTDVYFVGVPPGLSDEGVKKIFSRHGTVQRCFVGHPKEGQLNRYGFITFSSVGEAQKAIFEIDNAPPHNIHVEFARTKSNQKRKEEAQANEFENLKQQVRRESANTSRPQSRQYQEHSEDYQAAENFRQQKNQRPSKPHFRTQNRQYQEASEECEIDFSSRNNNLQKIQITHVEGKEKVVSYVNNNKKYLQEDEYHSNHRDKCLVEHYTANGPNNRANSRTSTAGSEFRNTDCGVVERRIMESSQEYHCSFVTQQLTQLPCTYCKKPGGFRCPRCKAWYCGQTCQLNDWPQHKLICRSISENNESVNKPVANNHNGSFTQRQDDDDHHKNVSQPNRPQRDNSQTNVRNCYVKDTARGPERTGFTDNHHERTPPKNFKKPTDANFKNDQHFKKPDVPQATNRVKTPPKPSSFDQERSKPNNFSNLKPENRIANGTDQGRGRASQNNLPNGAKELRKPLRKPGTPLLEAPAQVQSSTVSEFFRSGSPLVRVCYLYSPHEFYVQKISSDEALNTLLVELHQEATCGKPLNVLLTPGDHCIALFTDGSWYRAKVLKSLDSKSQEVYFVDYGNKETILLENMRLLPMKFRSLPEQALRCSIDKISPLSCNWDETSIDHFKTVISDVVLKAHLQLERNGTAVIDLEDEEGTIISNLMIELKSAKLSAPATQTPSSPETGTANTIIDKGTSRKSPTVATAQSVKEAARSGVEMKAADKRVDQGVSAGSSSNKSCSKMAKLPPPAVTVAAIKPPLPSVFNNVSKNSEPFDVSVTWIEDERNFWACVVDPEQAVLVAQATEKLAASNDGGDFVPSIGQAVGALSSDGCYYRALVKEIESSSKTYRVLFVDFGNQELVSLVVPLPPALAEFASPTLQLQLSQPHNITENTTIKLVLESATDNEAEFVLLNEEGENVAKVIGKPWFSGHLSVEKPPAPNSNTLPSPKTDVQPVKTQDEEKVSRSNSGCKKTNAVKAPLNSYLSNLHVQSEPFVAVVTWIIDSKNFWVSVVDEALTKKVAEVNVTLTECYDKDSVGYCSQPGQLVSAKSSDQTCYRAYIKSLSVDKAYHVLFVDYGNEEDVSTVAPLPPEAFSFPSPAIQMSVSEPAQISFDQVLYLTIATVETTFITFTALDQEGHKLLDMVAGRHWYSGHLIDSDSGKASPVVETHAVFSSLPQRQLDSSCEAIVVWAESAREIYLQRTSDMPQLAKLMSEIADAANRLGQILAPIVDQVVLALFSDGVWYRAKVLAVSSEEAHVHFIDYGNRAQVTMSELKLCPAEFSKTAPFAIHVSLDGIDDLTLEGRQELIETAWNVKETGKVQGLSSVQLFGPNGCFGSPVETENKIEAPMLAPESVPVLFTNETAVPEQKSTDIPETLVHVANEIEEICTIRFSEQLDVDIPQGEAVNILVSSVSAPTLIFVNYFPTEASVQKWNALEMEIKAYCDTTQPPADYSPESGQFCLAKFPEDNQWYRAVVLTKLSSSPVTYKVLFVDYGNMEDISNPLLPIPVRLMELPMQAAQCKLHGIVMEDVWSEEVCSALRKETMGKCFDARVVGKDEDTYLLDIPLVREKMVEMGVLQLDSNSSKLDTNTSLPVTTTDVDESSLTPEAVATTDNEQSGLSLEAVAAEPIASAVSEPTASEISNLEKNDKEDLIEQIKLLQAKLAAMQAN